MSVPKLKLNYLEDVGLSIKTKDECEENGGETPKPPKLSKKRKSLDSIAPGRFIPHTYRTNNFPSASYDPGLDKGYFEQCFVIISELGSGSFGTVYKVRDLDNQLFAVKVSKEPFRSDQDRIHKLKEVEYHQKFSYLPNVTTLIEAWEENHKLYLKMELCTSIGNTGRFSEEECWKVLIDMLFALGSMHEQEFGHFDVKLENILRGDNGDYRLTDFGLVFQYRTLKEEEGFAGPSLQPRAQEGDAQTLPSEVLQNGNFTDKADIFSLALTILELAGNLKLPSSGKEWMALRNDLMPKNATQYLSNSFRHLLRGMMSSDPTQRPRATDILSLPFVKKEMKKAGRLDMLSLQYHTRTKENKKMEFFWIDNGKPESFGHLGREVEVATTSTDGVLGNEEANKEEYDMPYNENCFKALQMLRNYQPDPNHPGCLPSRDNAPGQSGRNP